MCYDIKASYEAQLQRALRNGDIWAAEEIRLKLLPLTDLPLYHASGFSHPELLIYTDRSPNFPEVATWGLIPHWADTEEKAKTLWNKTLNARAETLFDKPSFKDAAKKQRCVVYVDGFYEHHHSMGNAYPFFIFAKDKGPLALAGIYTDWNNESGGVTTTFSIVTTRGNPFMAQIHNNPKLKGPRMPLILPETQAEKWLNTQPMAPSALAHIIESLPEIDLKAHTVRPLRGRVYKGNVPDASSEVVYEALDITID